MFMTDKTFPVHAPLAPEAVPDDLYVVAQDLMTRSNAVRAQGDSVSARRLLLAALNIMGEEQQIPVPRGKPASPETAQVRELLKQGWQEVSQLCEATGMTAARVHSVLARLRGRGTDLQTQAIKRYRIVPKE